MFLNNVKEDMFAKKFLLVFNLKIDGMKLKKMSDAELVEELRQVQQKQKCFGDFR